MRTVLVLSWSLWLVGCSATINAGADTGSPDAGSPQAGAPDAGSPDDRAPDAGSPDVGYPDAGSTSVPGCLKAGGVCASNASDCENGGGTVRADLASDCVFDDGPGACCVPPARKDSGDTCADHGGICAPIGGCLRDEVKGHFAPPKCGSFNPSIACCVPAGACPEPRPVCCSDTATFRATCHRGQYECFDPEMPLKYVESCQ